MEECLDLRITCAFHPRSRKSVVSVASTKIYQEAISEQEFFYLITTFDEPTQVYQLSNRFH